MSSWPLFHFSSVSKRSLDIPVVCSHLCQADSPLMCEGSDRDWSLSSSLSLHLKQSKHSAVLWRLTLLKVCATLDSLDEAWQPESETQPEEEEEYFRFRLPPVSQSADELYDLRNLCRVLQPREVSDYTWTRAHAHTHTHPRAGESPGEMKNNLIGLGIGLFSRDRFHVWEGMQMRPRWQPGRAGLEHLIHVSHTPRETVVETLYSSGGFLLMAFGNVWMF